MTDPNQPNWTDSAAPHLSRTPIIDTSTLRPEAQRRRSGKPHGAGPGPKSIAEQISDLEERYSALSGRQKDHVFLISNLEGVRDDTTTKTIIDVIASAILADYSPLGVDKREAGRTYADFSHVPPALWIPCKPLRFMDTHEAIAMARTIELEEFEPMFCGFEPDIPLASRGIAATFVTGNARPGQAFIEALERSLPLRNITVAHWNSDCSDSWAVFCMPATPFEINISGLGLDPTVYSPRRPGKSASLERR